MHRPWIKNWNLSKNMLKIDLMKMPYCHREQGYEKKINSDKK